MNISGMNISEITGATINLRQKMNSGELNVTKRPGVLLRLLNGRLTKPKIRSAKH